MIPKLARLLLIREQERPAVFYFLMLAVLVGMGLALGRGSADALFFKRYGVEYLPTIYTVLGFTLAATSISYAAFADRLASERIAITLFAVLAALLGICWWLMAAADTPAAYPLYYLVYQVASEVLVMHLALYLSQNFDTQQGKRLFPIVFGALEAGRILGGAILAVAATTLGMYNLVLVWIALSVATAAMVVRRHRRAGASPFYRPPPRRRSPLRRAIEQIAQGTRFARQSDLVRAQAGALFFLVISFYVLSYSINRIVAAHFPTEEELAAFLGGLSALTAATALLIQVLLTGRLLDRFGLKTVNLIFPVTHLAAHVFLLIQFALPAAVVASFNRDTVLPALRNPSRNLLLNVLPDYMQGRVRALLLGLVLPVALVVCGLGLHWLQRASTPAAYVGVGLVAALVLFFFSVRSNHAYLGAILSTLRERLFLPGKQLDAVLQGAGDALFDELCLGLESADPEICLAHARLLASRFPEAAAEQIAARLARAAPPLRDQLLNLLDVAAIRRVAGPLWSSLNGADPHYRATLLERLASAGDARAQSAMESLADDPHPRLRATGLLGQLALASAAAAQPIERLRVMLQSPDTDDVLAALHTLRQVTRIECESALDTALRHMHPRVRIAALGVLQRWPHPTARWAELVSNCLDDPDPAVHVAALGAAGAMDSATLDASLYRAFANARADVLTAARRAWRDSLRSRRVSEQALIDRLVAREGSPRQRGVALRLLLEQGIATDHFIRIANALLDELAQFVGVRDHLGRDGERRSAPWRLLAIVVGERCEELAELVMLSLEGMEDRATVAIIRAGLASRDRRQRANAREALGELANRSIAERLGELLDPAEGATPARDHLVTSRVDQWLAQCESRTDIWLAACVRHALGH